MINRLLNRRLVALILLIVLVTTAACSGDADNEEAEAPAPGNPPAAEAGDEELQVVVFETQAPTAPPVATPTDDTAGVVVGSGARSESDDVPPAGTLTPTAGNDPASGGATNPDFSRPPDVNPLTGLKVDDPAVLDRRPVLVRVGNDPAARPQVGLNQADIVYEEIVEWWVTRFTAIYLAEAPEMVAPIRSARLINLHLAPQYQGALGNSGGSDPVRWELSQTSIINLDEFFVPQPYFYRENEGWQTRLAFDVTEARNYLEGEDLEADVNLRGFIFEDSLDLSQLPESAVGTANEVIIPYPRSTSLARWAYDADSGKYLRFTVGSPMMAAGGEQIAASNVIIYFADHQETDIVEDSNGATSIRINLNGRGAAWLLRDGNILKGNWETDGTVTPNFIFDDGSPMPLKPGNTWVQVVPLASAIDIDGVEQDSLGAGAVETADDVETDAAEDEVTGGTPTPSPTLTPIGARPATATPAN